MAKSLTIALLAFAFAGLAVMAAPSSSEEVAPVSEEITEVQPDKGTLPLEQEGVPDKDEESRPTDELDDEDKELEKEGEEFEEEDEEINAAKFEVCTPITLTVFNDIKERLNLSNEEVEEGIKRFLSLLNGNNAEAAPGDIFCALHLMIGAAALDEMQKVLSLYGDDGGDDFSMVMEVIKELRPRRKNALVNDGMVTEDSYNTGEARKYVSLGLDME